MRAIDLVDRGGGDAIALRDSGRELWARDYDTVVVLSTQDWRVLRSARLEGDALGVRQFIGELAFVPGTELCLVARPFSGDVVEVDQASLKISRRVRLGRQPLQAFGDRAGNIVARDWKTGDTLRGRLRRRRWFGL